MIDIVYYKNDTLLTVTGVKNNASNAFVNNAQIQVTGISSVDGTAVTGATFPITLVWIDGSNGDYRCSLPSTLTLSPNTRYVCKLEATVNPGGIKAYWELTFTCRTRVE